MSSVYGYCRVSTQRQAENGESLEIQQRKIEGKAHQEGWTIPDAHWYIERGVSGSVALDDRPEGKRLLAVLEPGDVVIVSKLDRMFRSTQDALRVLEKLKARQVHLHLLDIGGDVTGNGVAQLVFTIMAAVAAFERGRIQERVQEQKEKARSEGRSLGGKRPFGWTKSELGLLVPNEEEQPALDLIMELYAKKVALRTIAATVEKTFGLTVSFAGIPWIVKREMKRRKAEASSSAAPTKKTYTLADAKAMAQRFYDTENMTRAQAIAEVRRVTGHVLKERRGGEPHAT